MCLLARSLARQLAVAEGQDPPDWVQEMLASNLVSEVHKFSKFIHGTAVLVPDLVQAVPYWFDDVSIRESILYSTASEVRTRARTVALTNILARIPALTLTLTVSIVLARTLTLTFSLAPS